MILDGGPLRVWNLSQCQDKLGIVPGGGGINQLTGDVTAGPGAGSQAALIASAAVTYAKMQNISAASRLLGRGSAGGAGSPEEITLGPGLSMVGTLLDAPGAAGGITQLTGDVTAGPGSGSQVATIAAAAVTLAKIQNFNTDKLIGRDTAGTGPAEAIDVTGGLEFTGAQGIQIADAGVTSAKLRDSIALSVIGRNQNSVGVPDDIPAVNGSDSVLRENGGFLAFGTVGTAGIRTAAVTNAKLRDSGPLSVIGRSANSTGAPADLSATAASGAVLRESGSVLGFGTIATAGIAAAAVTNAKLANVATATFKGRTTGGTGDPEDLTATQATALLNAFTSALKGLVPASGGGTTNFLRADGTFAAPAGTGINQLTGDVAAGPGSGSQGATIASDAVTFSKMQNITSDRLIGRDTAGVGDPEEIGLGTGGLEFTGTGEIRIADGAVTNARLANMDAFSFKGNNTALPAPALDLTLSQATAMINLFTSSLKGLVPASGGGTTNFLRADGTFAAPPDTGITELTGEVLAGPGSGSQSAFIPVGSIANNKLNAMQPNTIKGNNTVAGSPLDLTVAQVTAMLSPFTSLLQGLVPASGGGTSNFLRADGSFASPNGGVPAAHATSHQDGGSDEISVTGLSGLLADGQNPRVKQTEVDFGDVFFVNAQTFTITDASVSATSRIDCWLSGDAPTGKDADDVIAEDPLKFIVVPGAGTFNLYVEQPLGALSGKYKVDYTIGAAV